MIAEGDVVLPLAKQPGRRGERGERSRWQIQRPERVAAVGIFRGAPSTKENTGHRNRIAGPYEFYWGAVQKKRAEKSALFFDGLLWNWIVCYALSYICLGAKWMGLRVRLLLPGRCRLR